MGCRVGLVYFFEGFGEVDGLDAGVKVTEVTTVDEFGLTDLVVGEDIATYFSGVVTFGGGPDTDGKVAVDKVDKDA